MLNNQNYLIKCRLICSYITTNNGKNQAFGICGKRYVCQLPVQSVLHSRRPRVALLLFMETLCTTALYRVMWSLQSRETIYLKRPDFALMHLVHAILCTERVPVELGGLNLRSEGEFILKGRIATCARIFHENRLLFMTLFSTSGMIHDHLIFYLLIASKNNAQQSCVNV